MLLSDHRIIELSAQLLRAEDPAVIDVLLSDHRIIELSAQLLRAEDPAVIETVAAMLHVAVDQYVHNAKLDALAIRFTPLATEFPT